MCPSCCRATHTAFKFAFNIYISQDSVAKHLRCGGIFSDSIISYKCSPDSQSEKKFENWSMFDEIKE